MTGETAASGSRAVTWRAAGHEDRAASAPERGFQAIGFGQVNNRVRTPTKAPDDTRMNVLFCALTPSFQRRTVAAVALAENDRDRGPQDGDV